MFVDVARQVIVESISLKHITTVFRLSKKEIATRHALKTKLSFKSF